MINSPKISSQKKRYQIIGEFALEFVESLIISLGIFLIVYNFFVQTRTVLNVSMQPNFYEGDRIITDIFSYRLREPKRGEVIVLDSPLHESEEYLKRVIGLPGEEILIENNTVTIFNDVHPYGFILHEDYLGKFVTTNGGNVVKEGVKTKILEDSYLVMGDNRDRSSDSRLWGMLPKKDIVARVLFRYWPVIRIEAFAAVDYGE
ncbi:signal peptidase I [candidate division CPR3 bacterium GWF2_35_18]|uniref:Signal peptidase I n=1 Tax=candidate division CPR3 bacterium GW2011_GWF2_35_18 TaxID=1618350 RepID=A0A0G0E4M1_UNCC3|nr:MAG: Signal peptidase I [candidate division CPR3 bacterium GW2011_GWF2_35_18]KKP86095.1 MAG: Signal peptidase I [candidate division CPR3 bacterium GW2011_GWE2_35_7]OGB63490.1 MAG: signal peptidase I [candidate division CPR3 bacterium GWF2_35_18]OGB64765.1 MAG: signal peptidase I [candidate division CPR3 bacterium RIFOXYA2_FULL_35_13]OGB78321.1 MAG: signal peptidase I [candidate division CPR3 bacterium RIFOXYB2_FULL_35_8]OGB80174.1 MAG: signal peptidase I [candidate division CPR3 bacterium G